jgi:hypothetical protein
MRKQVWTGLAAMLICGTASEARAQPALTIDLAAASGGETNDVQLAYGGGVEVWRRGPFAAAADFVYVRCVAALTGDGEAPPEQRLSCWRTGVSVTVALGQRHPGREP